MSLFKTPEPRFLPVWIPGKTCPKCRPYACNSMRHPERGTRKERGMMALPKSRSPFREKRQRLAMLAHLTACRNVATIQYTRAKTTEGAI